MDNTVQIIAILSMLTLFLVAVAIKDRENNTKWDTCEKLYQDSGAPQEARDGIMRACFSQ